MDAPSASPRIVSQPSKPRLSKEQKRFNTLMKKLETERALTTKTRTRRTIGSGRHWKKHWVWGWGTTSI